MAQAALPIMIATSVFQAGASIAGGIAQKNALEARADAERINARNANTRRLQTGAARRKELNKVLGTIDTIRGSRGVGLDSPSGRAIRAAQRREGKFARNVAEMTHRIEEARAFGAAASASAAAPFALLAGFADAAGHLGSAASGFSSLPSGGA